jgi:hypothetical protein
VAPSPTTDDDTPVVIKKTTIHSEQPSSSKDPPYPERLNLSKPIASPEYDLITELKNVCIRIPLLQALKDIPIYAKIVRELCLEKSREEKKGPTHHTPHWRVC